MKQMIARFDPTDFEETWPASERPDRHADDKSGVDTFYNPSQPRARDGKWSSSGGGGGAATGGGAAVSDGLEDKLPGGAPGYDTPEYRARREAARQAVMSRGAEDSQAAAAGRDEQRRLFKEYFQAERAYKDARFDANNEYGDEAGYPEDVAKAVGAAKEKTEALKAKIADVEQSNAEIESRIMQLDHPELIAPNPSQIKPDYRAFPFDNHVAGVDQFGRLVDASNMTPAGLTPSIDINQVGRAHMNPRTGEVTVDLNSGQAVVVHELGHYLEYTNTSVHNAAQAFLSQRTAGQSIQRLSEVTGIPHYDASERTIPDDFISPYMGKIYPNSSNTEIVSMGLEMMVTNPGRLAREDPGYFNFIYDVMQGRYASGVNRGQQIPNYAETVPDTHAADDQDADTFYSSTQPRDRTGKWTSGGGGGGAAAGEVAEGQAAGGGGRPDFNSAEYAAEREAARQAVIARTQADRDRLAQIDIEQDAADSHYRVVTQAWKQAPAMAAEKYGDNVPEDVQKKIDALDGQRSEAWDRVSALVKEERALRSRLTVDNHPELMAATPMATQANLIDVDHFATPNVQRGVDTFNRMMDGGNLPGEHQVDIRVDMAVSRSHFVDGQGITHDWASANAPVTIHELGHWIEGQNRSINYAGEAFRSQRTSGEGLERLDALLPGRGYGPNEVTLKDNFDDPYSGRVYPFVPGYPRHTEIVSVGLEQMYRDPGQFAASDPGYFDFTYDVMKGRYSAPPLGAFPQYTSPPATDNHTVTAEVDAFGSSTQPRDRRGRWTSTGGGGAAEGEAQAGGGGGSRFDTPEYAAQREAARQAVMARGKAYSDGIAAAQAKADESAAAYTEVVQRRTELGRANTEKYGSSEMVDWPDDAMSEYMNLGHERSDRLAAAKDAAGALAYAESKAKSLSHPELEVEQRMEFKDKPSDSADQRFGIHIWGGQVEAAYRMDAANSHGETLQIEYMTTSQDRSAVVFTDGKPTIYLAPGSSQSTIVHEVGHVVERSNPNLYEAAVAFRGQRSTSAAPEPMAEIAPDRSYGSEEVAYRGDFYRPYVGKVYPNDSSTEVISVGLEEMYRDPAGLAARDPGYFNFMYDVGRGRYANGLPEGGLPDYTNAGQADTHSADVFYNASQPRAKDGKWTSGGGGGGGGAAGEGGDAPPEPQAGGGAGRPDFDSPEYIQQRQNARWAVSERSTELREGHDQAIEEAKEAHRTAMDLKRQYAEHREYLIGEYGYIEDAPADEYKRNMELNKASVTAEIAAKNAQYAIIEAERGMSVVNHPELLVENGVRLEIGNSSVPYEMARQIEVGHEAMRQFVDGSVIEGGAAKVDYVANDSGRAYYNPEGDYISLARGVSAADQAVHELGHKLETANPNLREAATAFREQRAHGPDELHSLRSMTGDQNYREDEVVMTGDFVNIYVGKVYPDGSTEVISMGLEMMHRDPGYLAEADPGYFNFVYDVAHGRYSDGLPAGGLPDYSGP